MIRHLCIVTRPDLEPTVHGAAVRIVRTAESLSRLGTAVDIVTNDRLWYYQARDGQLQRVRYPQWLLSLTNLPPILKKPLITARVPGYWEALRWLLSRLGYPKEEQFLYQSLVDPDFWLRLLYVGASNRSQVYQAEFPGYVVPALLASRVLGGQSALVEHNVEYQRLQDTNQLPSDQIQRFRQIERACARAVDHVIAVSEPDRRQLLADGIAPDRVTVIPHGVDLHSYRQASGEGIRARYGIPPRVPLLIFHGTLHYAPNTVAVQHIAEDLLPRLEAMKCEVRVLICGMNPPRYYTHPRIIFTDVVQDLAEHLKAADLAVVPLDDGGGTRLKILEYFAAGLPVVSTPKGAEGIPARAGQELILAEGMPAFAEAVAGLLRDPARARAMAKAGQDWVQAYDWDQVCQGYLRCYDARQPHAPSLPARALTRFLGRESVPPPEAGASLQSEVGPASRPAPLKLVRDDLTQEHGEQRRPAQAEPTRPASVTGQVPASASPRGQEPRAGDSGEKASPVASRGSDDVVRPLPVVRPVLRPVTPPPPPRGTSPLEDDRPLGLVIPLRRSDDNLPNRPLDEAAKPGPLAGVSDRPAQASAPSLVGSPAQAGGQTGSVEPPEPARTSPAAQTPNAPLQASSQPRETGQPVLAPPADRGEPTEEGLLPIFARHRGSAASRQVSTVADHLPPRPRGYKPPTLILLINRGCNLSCSFCDLPEKPATMPLEDGLRVLDQAPDIGVSTVVLTGGEPLLHPGLWRLVRRARAKGLGTNITTNGTLIERQIDELVESGVHSVSVSIDGLEATHDKLRGTAGSHAAAWTGLELLRRFGIRTTVHFVVTALNVRELVAVHDLARARGFGFDFWPVNGRPELYLNTPELERAFVDALDRLCERDGTVASRRGYYLTGLQYQRGWQRRVRCLGLVEQLGVDVELNVLPCCVWEAQDLRIGNLREQSLRELWRSAQARASRERLYHEGCQNRCYNHSLQQFEQATGEPFLLPG